MNVIGRGVRNALRNPLRSGIIILMLAISIGLVLCMLVARGSIEAKIADVKANTGNTVTINPAGVMGFAGGGNPLSASDVSKITSTAHVSKVVETLSDQLSSDNTSLTASLELGSFGRRFSQNSDSSSTTQDTTTMQAPAARTTVTGTTDPNSVATDGGSLNITSGATIDGSSSDLVALVGSDLATKNSLSVGSTFTAYGQTITVKGIFSTDNKFQDSGVIMPLATVQNVTSQAGDASSVVATVDSSDNVASTVTALKSSLGSDADVTSEVSRAEESVSSLQGIANLALAGVIGAAVAGAVIVLLTTIIVVRERRREIGVMKAIGGSNAKVIGQFVWESLTFTVIGMVIGLGIGVLVSGPMTTSLVSSASSSQTQQGPGSTAPTGSTGTRSFGQGARQAFQGGFNQVRNNLSNVTRVLTPTMFLAAIGITLLIAILGSAIPAWFISRIRPAEVLRTE
jgi:putative ABC transport system permease protein